MAVGATVSYSAGESVRPVIGRRHMSIVGPGTGRAAAVEACRRAA